MFKIDSRGGGQKSFSRTDPYFLFKWGSWESFYLIIAIFEFVLGSGE